MRSEFPRRRTVYDDPWFHLGYATLASGSRGSTR